MTKLKIKVKRTLGDCAILGDKARRKGEIAIDISGLSPEGQRTILRAFAEEEKKASKRRGSE